MKTISLFTTFMFSIATSFAQDTAVTKTGITTVEASVPSFEEVKATNKNSGCVLNTKTGEIVGLILIKGFKFRLALMEEHFNENYMESDKYPKAIFKGKIDNFKLSKLTPQKRSFTIKGVIDIHGKSKEITMVAKISKESEAIILTSDFTLITDDFDIDLPILVRSKVAKQVNVTINYILK